MKSIISTKNLLVISDDPEIIELLGNASAERLLAAVRTAKFRACFDALREASSWLPSKIYAERADLSSWLLKLDKQVQDLCDTFDKNRLWGLDAKDMDVPARNVMAAAERLVEKLEGLPNNGDMTAGKIASDLKLLTAKLAIMVCSVDEARQQQMPSLMVQPAVTPPIDPDANAPHNS